MLLRRYSGRLLGLGRLPQGLAQGLGPGAACGLSSSVQAGQQTTDGDGESLLARWRDLLSLGSGDNEDVRELLDTAIRLRQGKPSALPEQLISVFMQHYRQLDAPGRTSLLHSLTDSFGVQAAEVDAAAAAWRALRQQQEAAGGAAAAAGPGNITAPGQEPLLRAAAQLRAAATPPYARLFVPLSQQPGGIKFLVDMRAELLRAVQEHPSGAAPLRALSDALRASLAEWFSVGLLQLRRISWEKSSAELLEKVAAGEAVHEVGSWRDLKGRLDPATRRVYAFFHEAMPGEPLVVLHTALTSGVASTMAQLLPSAAQTAVAAAAGHPHLSAAEAAAHGYDRTWEHEQQLPVLPFLHVREPQAPTTAVFYSISATQRGLSGVDLGNFLIKQVAHCVQAEFPSVQTLCTLSPLPGFSDWVRIQLARVQQQVPSAAPLLLPAESAQLELVAAGHPLALGSGPQAAAADEWRAGALLEWALSDDNWMHSAPLEAAVQLPLLRLAAHYLLRERRRGLALDPVANFHLRNGAAVLRLNWRADTSEVGLRRSHGIMVNYHYELDRLADNNRAYLVDGAVTAAPPVEALLREA